MSTTVTYKGSTLTTVNNNTKTLKTAGKYMEGDVILTDVSGGTGAISVVDTIDSHGGTIREITALDISDTTAVASDVLNSKWFYTSDGTKTQGTATGGRSGGNVWQDQNGYVHLDDEGTAAITVEPLSVTTNGTYTAPTGKAYSPVTVNVSGGGSTSWVRPSDWPDLSKMDVSSGNIVYMTSYADEARGFCNIYVKCTGSYTVEVGTISGSTFTAESTHTFSSGSRCRLYYGSANGTYKVLRVTGTAITTFGVGGESSAITIDNFYGYTCNNGIIDVVGKLPSCTSMNHSYCYNLINMEISDVVLSGTMGSMFYYCVSLISLDTSGWDTSAVTSMSSAFEGCYSLTSLDVSDWDTNIIISMSSAFQNCYSLTSLDVSDWDTSAVTNMNNMFNSCHSLNSLDVSGWDTSAVTSMTSMFYYCVSLTSLDVSDWDTSAVTNMNNMFYYCYSLASLDVSSWDFSKITTTSNATSVFRNCVGLYRSITIPANITKIGATFFSNTRSLYEYHFLSTTPPELANTNAFNTMTDFGGKKIYVPTASLSTYQTATNWSTYASYMVGE